MLDLVLRFYSLFSPLLEAAAKREESLRLAQEKREAQLQAKREAEEAKKLAAEEARKQREAREEERKRNAEARKQVEFERYQRQLAIDKERAQQARKPKQIAPKKEEAQPPPRPSTPTFSLFGLGGQKEETPKPEPTTAAPPVQKKGPVAPRGVPTINKWKLNDDNTISGFISGSSNFNDGAPVTTSPITGGASSGSVVQTKSRSRYFLGEEGSAAPSGGGGVFGLFGGQKAEPAPAKSAPVQSTPNKAAEIAAERKRKAEEAALEKKRIAEGKCC